MSPVVLEKEGLVYSPTSIGFLGIILALGLLTTYLKRELGNHNGENLFSFGHKHPYFEAQFSNYTCSVLGILYCAFAFNEICFSLLLVVSSTCDHL